MLNYKTEHLGPHFTKYLLDLPGSPVVHHMTAPDHGDPHSHHFGFHTMICFGGYVEEIYQLDGSFETVTRKRGDSFYVPATLIHRIVELPEGQCVTCITPYEREQDSAFYRFREDGAWKRFFNSDQWIRC